MGQTMNETTKRRLLPGGRKVRNKQQITTKNQLQPTVKNIIGERSLLAAILARAILDYMKPTYELTIMDKRNVRKWINDERAQHMFSFNYCCQHIGLCPETLRNQIEKGDVDAEILQGTRRSF